MRILIGYNGSEASMAALDDLRYAGMPDKTEALVVTVAESWNGPKDVFEAHRISLEGVVRIAEQFPSWTVSGQSATGSPPREILARAETFKPDLIVVGEPRFNFDEHNMFLGHTSHVLLTGSDYSVRIARGVASAALHPERIIVGFNGTGGALHAIDSIVSRKWRRETEVRLLAVADHDVLVSIGRFTPQISDAVIEAKFVTQWAETLGAGSLEALSAAGIRSSVVVRTGNPKEMIIQEAEQWNADTVFVGPHCSLTSFERFLIGSVSAAVAARANCSVEIVRPPRPKGRR